MKLQLPGKNELSIIKKVYQEAFPKEEKKPFWMIMNGCRKKKLEMLYFDDNGFKGFTISMLYEHYVLIDYFAIQANERGTGCGSKALALLAERYHDKKIILEVEPPSPNASNNAQRIKRKQFYHRNGFGDSNLQVSVFGASLELMCHNCEITFTEYYKIYEHCYGAIAAKFLRIRQA